MLATPEMEGSFDALGRLARLFSSRVWIVSKAGPRIQRNTEQWLVHHRFFERTSILENQVRFVRRRSDKADVCRELGISHFVDDRAEVLKVLVGIVPHLFLFGPQDHSVPPFAIHVLTWAQAEREIEGSVHLD